MPNIIDILARALSLRQETALNSITPNRAGGIMYDTLLVLNQMQLEGGSLLISKVYASVSAMEADTTPTSDLTGRALKPGQLVVIVTSDSSSSDMGSEYRFNGPGSWTYVGKVGGLPLDTVPTQSSTKGITSGGVYTALSAMKAEGYKYMGLATPGSGGTAPGTPNQPVFYIAGPGSYPNFGSITVASGYLGFIKYSGGSWSVESVAVGKDYDAQISALDGQISQLEAEVGALENGSFSVVTSHQPRWSYIRVRPIKSGVQYSIKILLSSPAARTLYYYLKGEASQSGPWLAQGTIETGANSVEFLYAPSEDVQELYVNVYYNATDNITINISGPLGLEKTITELNERIEKVNSDTLPLSEMTSFDGWLDSSNKLLYYGLATYKVIRTKGGEELHIKGISAGNSVCHIMILNDFSYYPSMGKSSSTGFSPSYATGESGRRDFSGDTESTFNLPNDAKFILVTATDNNGVSVLPSELSIGGYSYTKGVSTQTGDQQKTLETLTPVLKLVDEMSPKWFLPIKTIRKFKIIAWQQGAVAVGEKIVGFSAGAFDHSTNGRGFVYQNEDFSNPQLFYHNLGHINGADYSEDADCLVTTEKLVVSTDTHTSEIILVKNFRDKVDNLEMVSYTGNDTIRITTPSLNGKYTGATMFGENESTLYLLSVEDPDLYYQKGGRWVYKVLLGMGETDLTSIYPTDSFGTFISGCEENEYNGTARIIAIYPFTSFIELQGGKFVNGRIVLPTNEYPGGGITRQAYFEYLEMFDGDTPYAKITKRYIIPAYKPDGTFLQNESEDCVIVGGVVYQQIYAKDGSTTEGYLYKFSLA